MSTQRPVAWDAEGVALGFSELDRSLYRGDRQPAECDLYVRPQARRRGLGSSLAARMLQAAEAATQEVVRGTTYCDGGAAFCERLGATCALETARLRLRPADATAQVLDDWQDGPEGCSSRGAAAARTGSSNPSPERTRQRSTGRSRTRLPTAAPSALSASETSRPRPTHAGALCTRWRRSTGPPETSWFHGSPDQRIPAARRLPGLDRGTARAPPARDRGGSRRP